MTIQTPAPFPSRHAPEQVAFDRRELGVILGLYGRMVAAGEWRDYGISHLRDAAVFTTSALDTRAPGPDGRRREVGAQRGVRARNLRRGRRCVAGQRRGSDRARGVGRLPRRGGGPAHARGDPGPGVARAAGPRPVPLRRARRDPRGPHRGSPAAAPGPRQARRDQSAAREAACPSASAMCCAACGHGGARRNAASHLSSST